MQVPQIPSLFDVTKKASVISRVYLAWIDQHTLLLQIALLGMQEQKQKHIVVGK
jgi:hypothetical protein